MIYNSRCGETSASAKAYRAASELYHALPDPLGANSRSLELGGISRPTRLQSVCTCLCPKSNGVIVDRVVEDRVGS